MKYKTAIIFLLILCVNFLFAQEDLSKPYDMNNGKTIITERENNNSIFGIEISERFITTSVIVGELGITSICSFLLEKN